MTDTDSPFSNLMGEDPGVAGLLERLRAVKLPSSQGVYDAALHWVDEGRPNLSVQALEELRPHLEPEDAARVGEVVRALRQTYAVGEAVMEDKAGG